MAQYVQHDRHTAKLEGEATPILELKDNDRDFLGDELLDNFNGLKTCSPLVRYIVEPVLFNIRAILNDIYTKHRVHFEKVQRLAIIVTVLLYQLIRPFQDTSYVQVPNTELVNMVLDLDSKVSKTRVDILACQRRDGTSPLALWNKNRIMRRIFRKATADVKNHKYQAKIRVFCNRYANEAVKAKDPPESSAAALPSPAELTRLINTILDERAAPMAQERDRLAELINTILDEREKQKASQSISGGTAPVQAASDPTSAPGGDAAPAAPAASAPAQAAPGSTSSTSASGGAATPASSISSAMPLPTVLLSEQAVAPGTMAPPSPPTISESTSSSPNPQG